MSERLLFCGESLGIESGETVLDCLLRHGKPIASSCRAGVCQSCLVQGEGSVPAIAQKGLKASLVAQRFYLACQCPAEDGLALTSADNLPAHDSYVLDKTPLSSSVIRVLLKRPAGLDFRAGQFIHLIRKSDGLTRSYSVASLPNESTIELHVALLPGGRMGTYVSETPNAPFLLRGPAGDCFYLDEKPDEPLLLVGTGTGLAPLLGVVRTALAAGHAAPIHLFHGARRKEDLYLSRELKDLEQAHDLFNYHENVLEPEQGAPAGTDLFAQVKEDFPSLKAFRIYLCGHPEFVRKMKKQCFLAGAAMQSIHSDPFVLATN